MGQFPMHHVVPRLSGTPGTIRTNVVQMPDGRAYFDIARTVSREGGGFHAPRTQYAIAIGCAIEHAHDLVYAVGRDLASRDALVPIEIDGGINPQNAPDCRQAGVGIIVAGSAVFGATDPAAAIRGLAGR